jgi:hypothetical protein
VLLAFRKSLYIFRFVSKKSADRGASTVYGLYRDGTELRAVYCSKKDVARDACLSLHSQCDYPILLGNDQLYGGNTSLRSSRLLTDHALVLYRTWRGIYVSSRKLHSIRTMELILFVSISTASELNGPLVLRHELGHSIIGVGEDIIRLYLLRRH